MCGKHVRDMWVEGGTTTQIVFFKNMCGKHVREVWVERGTTTQIVRYGIQTLSVTRADVLTTARKKVGSYCNAGSYCNFFEAAILGAQTCEQLGGHGSRRLYSGVTLI